MGKIADAFRGFTLPQQQKAQVLRLDREFVEVEAEVQSLKAKLLHLEAKVNPLEREVERLKKQVEESGASVHAGDSRELEEKLYNDAGNLPEIREKLLLILGQHGALDEVELAKKLAISRENLKFHAHEMKEQGLVDVSVPLGGMIPPMWSLTQQARKYLMARGLLK